MIVKAMQQEAILKVLAGEMHVMLLNACSSLREAMLTLRFIRESVGVDGEIEVRLNSERPEMDAIMRGWLAF